MNFRSYQRAGTGEKMQYLAHEFNDNTIRFVLRYPERMDAQIMARAVKKLVESVDVLHASFVPGKAGALWRVNADYVQADYFTCTETAQDPFDEALHAALGAIPYDGKVQLRCVLVQGEKEAALAFLTSHLCVDGSDGKYLLEKLCEAYRQIAKNGHADDVHVKDGSRAAEQMYADVSPRELRSLIKNPMTGVKTMYPFLDDEEGAARLVMCRMEKEETQRVKARAREKGATFHDALLAACYQVLAHMDGAEPRDPISIMSMMDLRRHCLQGESEGLCNLSGSMPTVLREGVPDTFEDTLLQITAQTKRFKTEPLAGMEGLPLLHGAAKTLPLSLLLKVAGRIYAHMSVGVTNLGNMDCTPLQMGQSCPTEGLFGGPLKKKPNMQISAASFDGRCVLCVVGSYTEKDAAQLQKTLEEIKAVLLAFAQA